MINTLPTWQAKHAANTLSHNDTVRLLGDANEVVKQLTAERDALRAALQPFADMAKYASGAMYQQGGYVAGLNTVEHYYNARRVFDGVKG